MKCLNCHKEREQKGRKLCNECFGRKVIIKYPTQEMEFEDTEDEESWINQQRELKQDNY